MAVLVLPASTTAARARRQFPTIAFGQGAVASLETKNEIVASSAHASLAACACPERLAKPIRRPKQGPRRRTRRQQRAKLRAHSGTEAVHMAQEQARSGEMDHVGSGEALTVHPACGHQEQPTWKQKAHMARRPTWGQTERDKIMLRKETRVVTHHNNSMKSHILFASGEYADGIFICTMHTRVRPDNTRCWSNKNGADLSLTVLSIEAYEKAKLVWPSVVLRDASRLMPWSEKVNHNSMR